MTDMARVLVIAMPGRLRDSLKTCLSSFSRIGSVRVCADVAAAVGEIAEKAPDLVVLDAGLEGPTDLASLCLVKNTYPSLRAVALVPDLKHQAEAKMAGADVVLLHGFVSEELLLKIEAVLELPKAAETMPRDG